MQQLERNGFTSDQVRRQLHNSNEWMFRYELLDSSNRYITTLGNVRAGSVANDSLAQIKRTAKFSVLDDGSINYLSQRIKPWAMLNMPNGGRAEWPLGVFILSSPNRKYEKRIVNRDIEAYDMLQILVEDTVEDRYTVKAGTNYLQPVQDLLIGAGITTFNLAATDKLLLADRDWEAGTTKFQIINDLLGAINYRSLFFDENGYAVAMPYLSPDQRASEYVYADDAQSIILPSADHSQDFFKIPNKWVLYTSESDQYPLMSVYVNSNPASPTSTVNRGRTITKRVQVDAADQQTLDAMAERMAFEDSQIFEVVDFGTAIMPIHSDSDVYDLNFSRFGLNAKYAEIGWSMDLKAGARMNHKIRRVVSV